MEDNRTQISSLAPGRARGRRVAARAPRATARRESNEWWDDLDGSILAALADGGKSPRELAERLGISEPSVTSLLYMLALEGRVRISRVEKAAG